MTRAVLISIFCPDSVGLIAAISSRLFDLGGNLADTTFAVLGSGAEFSTVCEISGKVSAKTLKSELRELPGLEGADISVTPLGDHQAMGRTAYATHRIYISGGDRPGLIARLSEVFIQYGANIMRLNAERIPGPGHGEYVVSIAVSIPEENVRSCLATVSNTAGPLGLNCQWEELKASAV